MRLAERFFAGRAGSKQPCLCVIYYMLNSGHIEGSFLVSRTGCVCERHAPCIEGSFLVSKTGHARERDVIGF